MKRFAVDIVLLPPDPILDVILEWNGLICHNLPNIKLDKLNFLPHVSIVMGCLPEEHLKHASTLLESVAADNPVLELQAPCIKTVGAASSKTVVSLEIAHTPALTSLHESVVRKFRPLLTQDTIEADIHDPPPIESSSIQWINDFIPNHCFQNYWPHITLGFGEPPGIFQPLTFQVSRLAICHLGNYCTCRKILTEEPLKR